MKMAVRQVTFFWGVGLFLILAALLYAAFTSGSVAGGVPVPVADKFECDVSLHNAVFRDAEIVSVGCDRVGSCFRSPARPLALASFLFGSFVTDELQLEVRTSNGDVDTVLGTADLTEGSSSVKEVTVCTYADTATFKLKEGSKSEGFNVVSTKGVVLQ